MENMEIPNCYLQTNWDSSIDQNDPFESALSSMVSSPTGAGSNGGDLILGDGMMMELIGRLGSISDSGEISCIATGNNSTNTSCYSTPSNSPSKTNLMIMGSNGNLPNYPPNLPPLNADPGFVERAAKFSSFGNGSFRSVVNLEHGKLSRVSSNCQIDGNLGGFEKKFGKFSRGSTPENGEIGDSREGSSVSEQNPVGDLGLKPQNDANSRKRKSIPKTKAKDDKVEQENEKSNAKRSKADDDGKKQNAGETTTTTTNNNNKDKQNNSKEGEKAEPPKDYIHVRARRGQATDSHSLAERVRREKISERMKFLQDLVPGCNKVTGKATVLDEIINYVQSLQRQVEFLSMKLSTFNPRMEFNTEALISKDMFHSKGSSTIPQLMYQLEQNSTQAFPLGYQSFHQLPSSLANVLPNGTETHYSLNPLNGTGIRRNPAIQLPSMAGFGDSITQMPNFWEDGLQSIVQMGIAQDQTQSVPGTLPNAQMKVEL